MARRSPKVLFAVTLFSVMFIAQIAQAMTLKVEDGSGGRGGGGVPTPITCQVPVATDCEQCATSFDQCLVCAGDDPVDQDQCAVSFFECFANYCF